MDIFVYGLFTDEHKATAAVTWLEGAGFGAEHISALMQVGATIDEEHPRFKVAMGRGAALGAALGTMGGVLVAVSGLLIAAPLTLSMAGGICGAAFGLLGGLSHWTENVDLHDHVANGMILVGAFVDDMSVERARSALAMAHPEYIHIANKDDACLEVQRGIVSEAGTSA